jgi:hypothetical protein
VEYRAAVIAISSDSTTEPFCPITRPKLFTIYGNTLDDYLSICCHIGYLKPSDISKNMTILRQFVVIK